MRVTTLQGMASNRLLKTFCSILLMSATFVFLQFHTLDHRVPLRKSFAEFPPHIGDWRLLKAESFSPEVLDILKPHDYLMHLYGHADGSRIWLFMGYWEFQRKGARVHSPKNCLPGSGWEIQNGSIEVVSIPDAQAELSTNRMWVRKGQERQRVHYWYHCQGKPVAGEFAARLEMVKNAIFHQRTDAALIRISTPIEGIEEGADVRITEFIREIYPLLVQYLPT